MIFLTLALALAADPAPPAAWQPPALPACDDVALLVKHDYAYVQQHICQLCGAADPNACEFDWPTNDVPSCSLFDGLRNGIYAYYGRPFESDKWKAHFAAKSWYRVNPGYSDALLSAEAVRNVAALKALAERPGACEK